jgi:hypothetical protein
LPSPCRYTPLGAEHPKAPSPGIVVGLSLAVDSSATEEDVLHVQVAVACL